MVQIVYFTLTGQTRRFIQKLDRPAYEIDANAPLHEMTENYVLIVPTYDKDVTKVVNDFIEYKNNRDYLKGVAGGGNRNFGEWFAYTAKDIARDYGIPLFFTFEFSGTESDVSNFKKEVIQFES